ncbi:MAG: helix-turn-helix transcriptional regulator [Chloroflexi bacterium]|nr:helix-turn-helix transcriptional regulator [Chloroflexota bacterium]
MATPYDREATGSRLREIRVRQGKTQADVDWMSGITQAALSNYENGKRDIPLRSLIALSGVLEISPADLVPALSVALDTAAAG